MVFGYIGHITVFYLPCGDSAVPRFTLDGDNLVTCLQNSPSCAAMFFEYAKEFTAAVKRNLGLEASEGQHEHLAISIWMSP